MLILKKLKWSNMFSYGENNVLELNKDPITQLVGVNGCLAGDTVIFSEDGEPCFIEDLVKLQKYNSTMASDKNLKHTNTEITDFIFSGQKEVFRVQLDSGDELRITANHMLLDSQGNWRELSTFKVDEFIQDTRYKHVDPIQFADPVYWKILAYLITEGGMTAWPQAATFSNIDLNIVQDFQFLLKQVDEKICLTSSDNRNWRLNFSRNTLAKQKFKEFLEPAYPGLIGYSYEKYFPKEFIKLPDSILDQVLAIYLDTDGTVGGSGLDVSFATSSKRLAQQLVFVLRNRYKLQVTTRRRKTMCRDGYEVAIKRLDQIKKFLARVEVHMVHPHKKQRAKALLERSSASTSYTQDLVPVSVLPILVKVPGAKIGETPLQKAYASLKATKHGITRANYELLRDNGVVPVIPNFNNIRFLRIKKIQSMGVHPVYDLTTNTSNFIADNILVHNSGKSSIPLILEEVLFNKNSKGVKKADIINRNINTNKYSATLEFELNNTNYQLELNRSGAQQKVKLLQNGTDISSHTATDTFKQVENLLGLDFKTFSQIVYQNPQSSLQFLTATDTARKNFLIDLLSLDEYVRIFEELKLIHKETGDSLVKLQAQVGTVSAWLGRHGDLDTKPMSLVEVPNMDTDLYDSLASLKQQLAQVDALNAKIKKNNEYKRLLSEINIEPLEIKLPDYSSDVQKAAVLKHEYEAKLATYKKYSLVKGGTCHTCYQPVNLEITTRLASEAAKAAEEIKAEYAILLENIKKAKAIEQKISQHNSLVADFEKYSSMLDASLPTFEQSKDLLVQQIKNQELELSRLKRAHQQALETNKQAEAHNAKLSTVLEQIAQFEAELKKLQPKLVEVESQLSLLDVLKKAFSTNGLIAYKIENSVKTLEALANEYLSELSSGRFLLSFQLNNDKLNVNIEDNGSLVSISALSAGELTRVTTATLLAIRKLMSSLSKTRINILFLDETIETLDTAGKEKLIEVLMQEHELNTFLISHSYSHPLVEKVLVVKQEGISRLENG